MRYGLSLLWVCLLITSVAAQQRGAVFEIQQSVPLVSVLEKLESQYDIAFSYSDRLANEVKVAPFKLRVESVEQLLEDICNQNNLEFRISEQGDFLLRAKLQPKINPEVPDQWLVNGVVVDEKGRPVADVAVYLDSLNIGTLTDQAGAFSFNIPYVNRNGSVFFQLIGYQTRKMDLTSLDENELPIQIKRTSLQLETVTVTEELPSIQQLQSDGALRLASLPGVNTASVVGSDIFRTVQLLPGVSAHDDLSAAIKIRGSSSDETLMVLDGIPIYKAEHFFGVFSAINSDYVQSTTLFKNALPASYGGKTGGMVLMESNEGLYNRFGGNLDINLLTSSAVLKAPLGDKTAIVLSGRTTYQDATNNPIFNAFDSETALAEEPSRENFTRPDLIETVPSFSFYDVNAKFLYQLNPRSKLDINYYQSYDDFSNEYDNSFRVRVGVNRFAENEESFSNLENWENQGLSFNYKYDFLNKWEFASNLYYTKFTNDGLISSELTSNRLAGEFEIWDFDNIQSNQIQDIGGKLTFSKSILNYKTLDFGLEIIQHDNNFELKEDDRVTLRSESAAYETSVFSSTPIFNAKNFFLNLGNRLTYYSPTDKIYWSPRLSFQYSPISTLILKGAFTHANQFVREFGHTNRLGQSLSFFTLSNDDKYPVGISDNFMLGASWRVGIFNFDLELYNKDFSGLIEHARVFQGFDPDEVNPGKLREYAIFNGDGQTQGLDFMASIDQGDYTGWLSYTLSKTEHRFEDIYRGLAFPSEDDRRHQLSIVNNYQWKNFNFSATYVLASGRPFVNLAKLNKPEELRRIDPETLFDRLPAYQRLDIGVSYAFDWQWAKCAVGLSFFNLTNNQNVKYQQFVYSIPYKKREDAAAPSSLNQVIGNTTNMLDRTLNLSFNVQF